MGRHALLILFLFCQLAVLGQSPSENASVKLWASVQASPPRITLNWVHHPGTSSVTIYRKLKNATTWGAAIATPSASSTQWHDDNVAIGVSYEYRIHRTGGGTANGYVNSGIQVQSVDYRGRILLLVDNTLASGLALELEQ